MYNRIVNPSNKSSFFIFGARGTGKTTWLKKEFFTNHDPIYIDLLDPDEEEKFSKDPNQLKLKVASLQDKQTWVVIDEVQKIPKLLDVVHKCIEDYGARFALTGSSARKLKRGHANLLAGRAFVYHLFPLTHLELREEFSLQSVLAWGSLPMVLNFENENDKSKYLKTYAQTYLKEEILMEQAVRKLDPFRQFLEVAAQQSGEIVNYSNIARDVGVDTVTVQSYFQILDETLVGNLLPAYHESVRKRQRQNPKFYFFDLGVARSLAGTVSQPPFPSTYGFGKLFEQLVVLEAIRLNSYFEKDFRLSYLRTKDDAEIDLVIERPGQKTAFVEIKSSAKTDERDVRTLKSFQKDLGDRNEYYCLSLDTEEKNADGIRMMHWQDGLKKIGFSRN